MDNGQTPDRPVMQQVCIIRIMCMVTSDEEAIEVKKKVSKALSDKPDAQIEFSIRGMPTRPMG